MSARDPRREVDAWVDDRMSDEERADFSARLRDDPELQAQVELRMEIRRALQDDPATVSPGFHTRARARFASSRRRRLPHPLSAEFIGLAAAVALAAVFFLPTLVERRLPGSLDGAEVPRMTGRAQAVEKKKSEPRAGDDVGAISERAGARDELAQAPASQLEMAEEPEAGPTEPARTEGAAPKGEPAPPTPPADRPSFADAGLGAEREAAPPPAVGPDARLRRAAAAEGEDAEETPAAAGAVAPRTAAVLLAAGPLRLDAGWVEAGALRFLRDADERARLDRSLEGRLAAAGGLAPGTRVALIGPRTPPIACEATTVRDAGDRVEIVLGRAGAGREAAAGGCAVVLADDGRRVELVEDEAVD
jgi:hypothetical protein